MKSVTKFSVFLPVRNGWPYVQECVESILAQTYPHWELNVLNNQSKDNTVPWLKSLGDKRIRLWHSDTSLSIVDSWARMKKLDKQEYMTMIGHDDKFDPGFLATIKMLIERHPRAALYQTGSRLINSDGKTIRSCREVPELETAAEYLKARFGFRRDTFGTGFVMRSADYDRLGGIPSFEKLFFADDALWLSLILGSCKASDQGELFSVRIHPKSESASLPSAWSSILLGLNQFKQFLDEYVKKDEAVRRVIADYGPGFWLTYHRNIYIFALIEASIANRSVARSTFERINSSLAESAPSVANKLQRSFKVAAIEKLNSSALRRLVPHLWKLYNSVKSAAG